MPFTVAGFKARFPGLKTAPDGLVTPALVAAQAECAESVWQDLYSEGVLHLAAYKVTIDTAGIKAKKVTSKENVYLTEYNRLMRIVAIGATVSGPSVTNSDLGI